jgi:uncharacterized coiled-coil DUF342 family protein
MSEAIIVALITAGAGIIGQWLIAKAQHDRDKTELAVTLKGIEDRLDEHNSYASKIGGLAEDIGKLTISMTEMQKDIEYLRKGTQI